MNLYIIYALTGDYSKVAETIEQEMQQQSEDPHSSENPPKNPTSAIIDKLGVQPLQSLAKRLSNENVQLEKQITAITEELRDTRRQLAAFAAAFGEIDHFVQEAARIAKRHFPQN